MRNRFGFFALVAIWVVLLGFRTAAQEPALAFVHVNVIDATGSRVQADMTVVVQGKEILQIGKSKDVAVPKSTKVVESRGKYLIPGLWDMHAHEIFGAWLPEDEKVIPLLFVANGVTGVRDMGGDLEPLKRWRSRIAAGEMIGLRMIIAGPMLDGPVPAFPSSAPIKDAADGRNTVDELKKNGADFIKIQSLVPRDGYFAAADEARKTGIVFAGHVPDKVRAVEASNAGQKSVEHLTGVFEGCSSVEDELMSKPRGPGRGHFLATYDPERAKELIALFAKNQTWQVPTLYWEQGEWLIEKTNILRSRSTGQICPGRLERQNLAHVYARHHAKLVHRSASRPRKLRARGIQDGWRDEPRRRADSCRDGYRGGRARLSGLQPA